MGGLLVIFVGKGQGLPVIFFGKGQGLQVVGKGFRVIFVGETVAISFLSEINNRLSNTVEPMFYVNNMIVMLRF